MKISDDDLGKSVFMVLMQAEGGLVWQDPMATSWAFQLTAPLTMSRADNPSAILREDAIQTNGVTTSPTASGTESQFLHRGDVAQANEHHDATTA
ncbi:hypothetical protein Sjap_002626 [Stephania japonica]|uniref:Uncharacterized protein n=1 Tax=Stephania japonica TaxID=461633 RepID=A0AAP0KMF3_9MAGN